ncbi:MAG: hypothetical protein R3325_00835 [Thermoanaerobaculia bacterium]|nr:hypothetical protein [Thermoanaerobaculia bacterium]
MARPIAPLTALVALLAAGPAMGTPPTPPRLTPPPGAQLPQTWIGPVYFSWFRVNRHGSVMGQYYGPWVPLEGRRAWDGSEAYHRRQIAEIAKARFNMIFAVDTFEYRQEQSNLFAAIAERRARGREAPRVAPYFAAGSFACRDCPKRFDTAAGKGELYRVVRKWFDRFLAELGGDDLVWVDGRVLVGLWWVPGAETAEPGLFEEMNRRLRRDFGVEAWWSVNFTWQGARHDEVNHLFASLSGLETNLLGNVDLLVGFWPPEGQDPTNFLPRDGGATYQSAWDAVIARATGCGPEGEPPRRISVVSYNELTEGSGIFPAVCSVHNTRADRHWSGRPNRDRCVDRPCHPFRKQDRWATDCSQRRAPYLYLDITRKSVRRLERAARRRAADCRGAR